jgi:hypothetical protein
VTEAEWCECREPDEMLDFLRETGGVSHRKRELFGCACVRRVWALLADPRSRHGVATREEHLERDMPPKELAEACTAARIAWSEARRAGFRLASGIDQCAVEAGPTWATGAASCATLGNCKLAAELASRGVACTNGGSTQVTHDAERATPGSTLSAFNDAMRWEAGYDAERAVQAALLCDIFGPAPFRRLRPPSASLVSWNDGTVRRITEAVYEHRQLPFGTLDNARLAILADALLDAGCDDEALMAHCRTAGPHVRGCWGVDLILGKS